MTGGSEAEKVDVGSVAAAEAGGVVATVGGAGAGARKRRSWPASKAQPGRCPCFLTPQSPSCSDWVTALTPSHTARSASAHHCARWRAFSILLGFVCGRPPWIWVSRCSKSIGSCSLTANFTFFSFAHLRASGRSCLHRTSTRSGSMYGFLVCAVSAWTSSPSFFACVRTDIDALASYALPS